MRKNSKVLLLRDYPASGLKNPVVQAENQHDTAKLQVRSTLGFRISQNTHPCAALGGV
jgi:hypothetical protein